MSTMIATSAVFPRARSSMSYQESPRVTCASSSRTRSASSPTQPVRASHGSSSWRFSTCSTCSPRGRPGVERAPLVFGVVAHVRRVAELLGFLHALVGVQRVLDDDDPLRDARHLADRRLDVVEVVRRDAADDGVEASGPRREDPRRARSCRRPCPARDRLSRPGSPPRPAAARRVRRRWRRRARSHPARPVDDEVEIGTARMRLALAVGLRALCPDVGHAATSSTARCAASSIVGSTSIGAPDSSSSRRPSSAFVPSSRTTIGWLDLHPVERREDPARDLVAARDSAEDVEEDGLTCGSEVMTSSASTTPSRVAPAPEVAEVRRPAAGKRDTSRWT